MASVRVVFPAESQHGNALHHLRKRVKSVLTVEVDKQADGALVVCSDDELGSLLLLLKRLEGCSVAMTDVP